MVPRPASCRSVLQPRSGIRPGAIEHSTLSTSPIAAASNELVDLDTRGVEAALEVDAELDSGGAAGLDRRLCVLDARPERLLAEDVLACCRGGLHFSRVRRVRSGDVDDVDAGIGEKLVEARRREPGAVALGEVPGRGRGRDSSPRRARRPRAPRSPAPHPRRRSPLSRRSPIQLSRLLPAVDVGPIFASPPSLRAIGRFRV